MTFKWSRLNRSVVSSVSQFDSPVLVITKATQEVWADSEPGQWLEIVTLAQELNCEPGVLVPLVQVNGTRIEFDPSRIVGGALPTNPYKVYRWDHKVTLVPSGAIPIGINSSGDFTPWLELERGIQVQFAHGRRYRSGDYWLIPSRSATNGIEWPVDRIEDDIWIPGDPSSQDSRPIPQPSRGIEHQYIHLGFFSFTGDGTTYVLEDKRELFPPLQRAVDKSGDTIKGPLVIDDQLTAQKLNVTDSITSHSLTADRGNISGCLSVDKGITSNNLTVAKLIQSDGLVDSKQIKAETLDVTNQVKAGSLVVDNEISSASLTVDKLTVKSEFRPESIQIGRAHV